MTLTRTLDPDPDPDPNPNQVLEQLHAERLVQRDHYLAETATGRSGSAVGLKGGGCGTQGGGSGVAQAAEAQAPKATEAARAARAAQVRRAGQEEAQQQAMRDAIATKEVHHATACIPQPCALEVAAPAPEAAPHVYWRRHTWCVRGSHLVVISW